MCRNLQNRIEFSKLINHVRDVKMFISNSDQTLSICCWMLRKKCCSTFICNSNIHNVRTLRFCLNYLSLLLNNSYDYKKDIIIIEKKTVQKQFKRNFTTCFYYSRKKSDTESNIWEEILTKNFAQISQKEVFQTVFFCVKKEWWCKEITSNTAV